MAITSKELYHAKIERVRERERERESEELV